MEIQSKCCRLFDLLMGGGLISILLLTPAFLSATENGGESELWGKWEALDNGYLARRKVPPKLNNPVNQRLTAKVQPRLDKAQRLEERLLKKLLVRQAGGDNTGNIERQLAQIDLRIGQLQKNAKRRKRGNRFKSLWFRTISEGLHGVTISDLADQMNKSTGDIRKLAKEGSLTLTNQGKAVSWYFDQAQDMILFAAQLYDSFYTDENAYQFNLGKNSKSQPMKVRDKKITTQPLEIPGNDLTTQPMEVTVDLPAPEAGDATPFRETLLFEEEPDMFFSTWVVNSEPDADYWFWDYLYGGYKDTINVDLVAPNPANTGTARLRIRMRGFTDMYDGDEHEVTAELNGIPLDGSIVWDGFNEAVLGVDFDQSFLNTTGSNKLTLHNSYTAGTHPGQYLDDIELVYSRLPVAVNDQLWLYGAEAGFQTVTGFSSDDIMVIESPAGKAILRKDIRIDSSGSGYSVTFATSGHKDYLVSVKRAIVFPTFDTDNPSHLISRRNKADYLIITPHIFEGTAQALAVFRSTEVDNVKVVYLEDIYNQFSHGVEDPHAVTRLIKRTEKWRVRPSVVVLVGKGSLDHKDRMGYGDSFLPTLLTDTPWALAASDDRLLGGDGDAPYVIGRLPITNDAEGIAYVDKLIAYESTPSGDARYQALLVADNPDDGGDFHSNSDALADRLMNSLGFDWAEKLYHPQDAVRATLIQSDTWEIGYVSYDGHGSVAQVGDGSEKFISTTDADALQNATLPVFTALTCAAGDFTQPGVRSLVGALVLNPSGGAIASLAPTGLSLDTDVQTLGNAFVDALFRGYTIGNAVKNAKRQTQGDINGFMHRIYSVVGEPLVNAR